jgi:hypothetical protein
MLDGRAQACLTLTGAGELASDEVLRQIEAAVTRSAALDAGSIQNCSAVTGRPNR